MSVYYFTSRFAFNDFLKRLELRAAIASRILFEKDQTSIDAFNELRDQYLEVLPQEKEYVFKYRQHQPIHPSPQRASLNMSFVKKWKTRKGGIVFEHVKDVYYAGLLYSNAKDGRYLDHQIRREQTW